MPIKDMNVGKEAINKIASLLQFLKEKVNKKCVNYGLTFLDKDKKEITDIDVDNIKFCNMTSQPKYVQFTGENHITQIFEIYPSKDNESNCFIKLKIADGIYCRINISYDQARISAKFEGHTELSNANIKMYIDVNKNDDVKYYRYKKCERHQSGRIIAKEIAGADHFCDKESFSEVITSFIKYNKFESQEQKRLKQLKLNEILKNTKSDKVRDYCKKYFKEKLEKSIFQMLCELFTLHFWEKDLFKQTYSKSSKSTQENEIVKLIQECARNMVISQDNKKILSRALQNTKVLDAITNYLVECYEVIEKELNKPQKNSQPNNKNSNKNSNEAQYDILNNTNDNIDDEVIEKIIDNKLSDNRKELISKLTGIANKCDKNNTEQNKQPRKNFFERLIKCLPKKSFNDYKKSLQAKEEEKEEVSDGEEDKRSVISSIN